MAKSIYLRALEPDDYKVTIKWRKDEGISQMVGGPKYFVSEAKEKVWMEKVVYDNTNVRLGICQKEDDKLIGMVVCTDIDQLNQSCQIHIFIGDRTAWGKGIAVQAQLLMLEYMFNERNIHRVVAYVLETNKQSIRMFEKCGYIREGCIRDSVYKGGKFQNQIILSILKRDFMKMNGISTPPIKLLYFSGLYSNVLCGIAV